MLPWGEQAQTILLSVQCKDNPFPYCASFNEVSFTCGLSTLWTVFICFLTANVAFPLMIPSRGIAFVVPAAPGTILEEEPMTGRAEKPPMPSPTTRLAFSSKVIAAMTASILSARNCSAGCAAVGRKANAVSAVNNIVLIFIES